MHNHLVIGTAGHIDHGKSTLVKALTAIDPDRLEEEKKRGITIVLGYAHIRIDDDEVSFVDVPGHERFVKTMLSGVTGIDAVMLIVAADEGIMPQTLEHFAIAKHLAVNNGFIVITKADRASDEQIDSLKKALAVMTIDSFLEGKPIFVTAIDNPDRYQVVRAYLKQLLEPISTERADLPPRMYIDRVFTLKGKGTVVTGTLIEGTFKKDDILYAYPSDTKTRIKQIQIHGESVNDAVYGHRVAMNLTCDMDAVKRGDLLTTVANRKGQYILDVEADFDQYVRHWQRIRFFHGTREVMGRLVLTNQHPIESDTHAVAQIRLEEAVFANIGDRFIMRRFSPVQTIGGGIIANANAKKHHITTITDISEDAYFNEQLNALQEPFDIHNTLFDSLSTSKEMLEKLIKQGIHTGNIIALSDVLYMTANAYETKRDAVYQFVESYHEAHPYRFGVNRAELKSKCFSKYTKQVFDRFLVQLYMDKTLRITAQWVHIYDFEPTEDAAFYKLKSEFDAVFEADALKMAKASDLIKLANKSSNHADLYRYLKYRENIVKINEDRYMLKAAYDSAREAMLTYFENNAFTDVASYRDLLGTSRKNSVMLLEHFDEIGLTKRIENKRVLIK
ncbi:selenocysteine-specific translation elongation factor [Fusibacter paucivorans]|uniref:Selenocysteine-specific elongation factor n=1 Tax=Fusibacter paucivorans TaxID=76009 RepID=A0ABS5PNQ6_9FIRM|nr:selenocysteine-specific translation elongation factor [Fusibacter paucivorans]MBS7526810.1 selenocysteine-specific translation elongation factor [Fusibacter paucivorans]